MARTPDRRPGETDEEGILLENRPSGQDPTVTGGIRYVNNAFKFKDTIGLFDPRYGQPGGSSSEVQFNDSGVLSGSTLFKFDKLTGAVTASSFFATGQVSASFFTADKYIRINALGDSTIPIGTTPASYIFASGSNNVLHFGHYHPQDNFQCVTSLDWINSTLSSGLLYGGLLSTQNGTTTFTVASGSGLIIEYNTSPTDEPRPLVKQVTWPTFVSQSLDYSGSAQITYIAIDEFGAILQQTTPYSTTFDNTIIPLGRVLHQTGSVTNGVAASPTVSYGSTHWHEDFTKAFGPLKISGHKFYASGSNLTIIKEGGTSYAIGRNYPVNPGNPNNVTDPAITVSKVYKEYTSGSSFYVDTGVANAGYTEIDPTRYNNNGTLTSIGGSDDWSIQRVFWFPNSVNKAFYIYYGEKTYPTVESALNGLNTDPFTEGSNTAYESIFLGYIVVQRTCTNLSDTNKARLLYGGIARGTSGGGGGAASPPVTPGGLDTYVQFNDGGSSFGGDTDFTYDKTTNVLTVGQVSLGDNGTINTSGTTFSLLNTTATNISFAGAATTLTVGNTAGTNTIYGSVNAPQGFSGSLTKLTSGGDYLIAGGNITLSTGSLGSITIAATGVAQSDSPYLTIGNVSSLSGERAITMGTGLLATDAGANSTYTLSINDNVVATVSGTTFTGAVKFIQGLSGSLTKLTNGSDYLLAGSNVTLATGSSGAVTISAPDLAPSTSPFVTIGNDSTLSNERSLTAGTGISLTDGGANSTVTLAIRDNIVATISGATFTGVVNFNQGLSGSLTKLTNGSDYLVASSGITLTTGSNGSISIATTGLAPIGSSYLTINNDSTLTNERAIAMGTGLKATDGGANNSYTLSINDNVVATVSGTTFTGAVNFNQGLSGSLTKLTSGADFLLAGSNVTLSTGSSGAVTIAAPNLAPSTSAFVTIGNDSTLSNERSLTAGTGISLTDGGANSTVTLAIRDNIVATISGATFTGAVNFNQGLSGSLTKLTSGADYLLAGSNVTLSTGSSGAITISAPNLAPSTSAFVTVGNDSTLSNERALAAGTGLTLTDSGANSNVTLAINNGVVATISGSTFTGAVNFNQGLSGSLTKLTNGSSYLIAGTNIGISTGSSGAVTISNTAPTFYQWNELATSRLNTTASVAIAGGLGSSYTAESVGSDVYFFVSGSSSAAYGTSVFGGDLVVSGTLQTQTITNFSPASTTTALTLNGSTRGTSGAGRGIALTAAAGTTTVAGGTLVLTAGNSGGAASTGGSITFTAGSSSTSAGAGSVTINAGDTSSTTAGTSGGNITLAAGSIPSGGTGTAGNVSITTGAAANAAATPGNITLTAQRSKVILRRTTATVTPGTDTFFYVTGSVGAGVTDRTVFAGEVYVSGSVTSVTGLTGSLTSLANGTPYLLAGGNIALTTGSSGAVTIAWSTPTNNVLGTGTTNYVAKFTAASTIGDTVIYDTGTNVGIGVTTPSARFEVSGTSTSTASAEIVRAGIASPLAAIFDVQNVNSTSLVFVSGSGELGLSSNSVVLTATTTTATTSATTLMSVSSTTYRSAEFVLHGVDATGGKYMTAKVLAIHNGTTTNFTEYAQVNVGGIAGTTNVTNPSAGSFLLQVTPASTNSTVWRVTAILTRA